MQIKPIWVLGIWGFAGLVSTPLWAADPALEKEIAGLDESSQKKLAQDMVQQMEAREPKPETQNTPAPAVHAAEPQPAMQATGMAPAPKSSRAGSAPITVQPEGHILITTGDRIGFSAPAGRALQLEERLWICQQTGSQALGLRKTPPTGNETVGKLKIIEIQDQIVWGQVMAASEVILLGDRVSWSAP